MGALSAELSGRGGRFARHRGDRRLPAKLARTARSEAGPPRLRPDVNRFSFDRPSDRVGRMSWIVWVVALGLAAGAEAKTISITIGQKAELRGESLVVKTTVGNTGDEAAKSVAANLRFGDKQVRGKLRDELAPNATFEEELTIATGTLGEGRWPYQIAVDYADANLYPFQALLVTSTV